MRWLYPVLVVLLIPAAAGFSAEFEVVDRSSTFDNPAEFRMNVTNNASESRNFRLGVSGLRTSWWSYSSSNRVLDSGESEEFLFTFNGTVEGNYSFTASVTDGVQRREFDTYFTADPPEQSEPPSFLEVADVNAYYGESSVLVNLSVNSSAEPVFEGVEVVRSSGTGYTVRVDSREGSVDVSADGLTREFEYEAPNPDISPEVHSEGFLMERVSKSYTNTYPVVVEEELSVKIPRYLAVITRFEEPADSKEISGLDVTYRWTETIPPGETTTVEYVLSRGFPLAVVAGLLLGFAGLRRLQGELELQKLVEVEDGELKVVLKLENGTGTVYRGLELSDFLPGVLEPGDFETAEPVVSKTEDGTRMKWSIDELKPGETRVLIYSASADFEVESVVEVSGAQLKDSEGFVQATSQSRDVRIDPEEPS